MYALEKKQDQLRWYFDEINIFNYNISNLNPDQIKKYNDKLEFDVNLVVGGPKFSVNWTLDDIADWECPSLIVDYIRIYDHEGGNYSGDPFNDKLSSPDKVCQSIKQISHGEQPDNLNQGGGTSFQTFLY